MHFHVQARQDALLQYPNNNRTDMWPIISLEVHVADICHRIHVMHRNALWSAFLWILCKIWTFSNQEKKGRTIFWKGCGTGLIKFFKRAWLTFQFEPFGNMGPVPVSIHKVLWPKHFDLQAYHQREFHNIPHPLKPKWMKTYKVWPLASLLQKLLSCIKFTFI